MAGWGNSFSLLDEDESGEGAVRVPVKAAAPAVAKPVKEEPKTAHKNAAVTDNKESGRKPERQQRAPRAREERGPRDESAEQQQQQGGAASTRNNEGAFNRTRGPNDRSSGERRERRDNGASGAPGAARAPRQFDRRSGTGRGREVQRGGAGRGNWGSDEQEIQEQVKAADPGDASVDNAAVAAGSHDADWSAKNDDSWGAAAPAADAATGEQPAKEEKAPRELTDEEKQRQADREAEAKLMTLDEYLEKKKKLDYQLPAPRQAGEGEDSKQWAGFVAAKSDKQQAAASDSPASAKKTDEKKVKEQKKVPLPAELLKFKGEQQRRDNERRESRPPRDGQGYERRERREDQPPRAPRANNNNNNGPAKQTKQAEFGAQDFPSLKA